jgi:hypothetical protein
MPKRYDNIPHCGTFQRCGLADTMLQHCQGVSMVRCASIGIAWLVLLLFVVANASSARAQAGSTGGSIGKQEKSISGGEETERPRAVSRAKRPAAVNNNRVNVGGVNISGTWGSNIGTVYRITQSGNSFRWVVVQGTQTETGNGTLASQNVSASWSGTNGSGSASGVIGGGGQTIEWSNGVIFMRR